MKKKPKIMIKGKSHGDDDNDDISDSLDVSFKKDNALEDRGIIVINEMISKDSLASHYKKILALHFDSNFTDEVQVILNSPGGYNDGGWAFIDLLNFIKNPVRTIATGEICSMATMIFISGDHRVMSPNSVAMIHQFSSYSEGTYGDLVANRKAEDMEHAKIIAHFIHNSKYKNEKEVLANLLLDHDHWLSPFEMYEHGLCDEVMKVRPKHGQQKTRRKKQQP